MPTSGGSHSLTKSQNGMKNDIKETTRLAKSSVRIVLSQTFGHVIIRLRSRGLIVLALLVPEHCKPSMSSSWNALQLRTSKDQLKLLSLDSEIQTSNPSTQCIPTVL